MQHFSDRKKASIISSFSSRRGAIYDASQVKSGAIYDAPQVRSGAIYDALQVRSGAICDAANSRRAAIFHASKFHFLLKNQFLKKNILTVFMSLIQERLLLQLHLLMKQMYTQFGISR